MAIAAAHPGRHGSTMAFINAEVSQDPTLPHTRGNLDKTCGNCGHDDAVFFQAQSNREKSKMKLHFVCCNCSYKWCDSRAVFGCSI